MFPHLRTVLIGALAASVATCSAVAGETAQTPAAPWSRMPPAGLAPSDVPQLVAITFDDNFGLAAPRAVGGVSAVVEFYRGKHNPPPLRSGDNGGAAITTTFFNTSVYMIDPAQSVIGGNRGEDRAGRNLAAWKSAAAAGHEMADHTVNHFNGGGVGTSAEACCRQRNFSVAQWSAEIAVLPDGDDRSEFRPWRYARIRISRALPRLQRRYVYGLGAAGLLPTISSLPNCFAADEDGTNCSWPYRLDAGSPDAEALARHLGRMHPSIKLPAIEPHAGMWELPVTTLIVPPDADAAKYGFKTGLRERIAKRAPLVYPSLYEASTGKITGLDYALLIDAGITGDEMRAILSYNLDLHLAGNRAPLIFVAHSHLYAFSGADDNPDTPSNADRAARWNGLAAFITYALTKPDVRMVGTGDVLAWMQGALAAKR